MADLPLVSVVMANYRSARFLRDAIDSVLKQTMTDLELIIVDDVSNDGSLQIIEEYIEHDSRVRLIALSQNLGPSGARNRGLEEARGEWIAIVDSDDHIHPERFKILIAAAERDGADLVADDLLIFDDSGSEVTTMLNRDTEGFWVGEAEFIRANSLYSSGPVLGYCKPLIRRSALAETRYDTTLRIGEDFDLILRLLFAGCKFKIYPDLLYFYRKHSGSISHRFNKAECLTLLAAEVDRVPPPNAVTPEITSALAFRIASLRRALAFAELVQCLKTLSLRGVVRTLWRNPSVLPLLRLPIIARVQRSTRKVIGKVIPTSRSSTGARTIVVLSHQRIGGPTNGSSTYLMSIAQYLRERGFRVNYVSPSPATFGRRPFVVLNAATFAAFDHVVMHGGMRLGSVVLARDPSVWISALLTVVEDLLIRSKFLRQRRIAPAPYSISVPLTRKDRLFVARQERSASAILLDYAFLTRARPYLLRPEARALILMHDLFSNRDDQFKKAGAVDSVALLSRDEEMMLLSQSDGVIAIQKDEAAAVASALPKTRILLAPMAIPVQSEATPGLDGTLLFVGSNTAPNIIGLQWFLAEVWPLVLAKHPSATLNVAGSVTRGLNVSPAQVQRLGVVPDLSDLYKTAGIVISPLTLGSGLKIKLVEAMSFGKAIVATSVTMEGIALSVYSALRVADEATTFANSISEMLFDAPLRADLGEAARMAAQEHFAREACYRPIFDHMNGSEN